MKRFDAVAEARIILAGQRLASSNVAWLAAALRDAYNAGRNGPKLTTLEVFE